MYGSRRVLSQMLRELPGTLVAGGARGAIKDNKLGVQSTPKWQWIADGVTAAAGLGTRLLGVAIRSDLTEDIGQSIMLPGVAFLAEDAEHIVYGKVFKPKSTGGTTALAQRGGGPRSTAPATVSGGFGGYDPGSLSGE